MSEKDPYMSSQYEDDAFVNKNQYKKEYQEALSDDNEDSIIDRIDNPPVKIPKVKEEIKIKGGNKEVPNYDNYDSYPNEDELKQEKGIPSKAEVYGNNFDEINSDSWAKDRRKDHDNLKTITDSKKSRSNRGAIKAIKEKLNDLYDEFLN